MTLRAVLEDLLSGKISINEAEDRIKLLAIEEIGEKLKLDYSREYRINTPEIILAEYKDIDTLRSAIVTMVEKSGHTIVTRIKKSQLGLLEELREKFTVIMSSNKKIAVIRKQDYKPVKTGGRIGVVTAGTADIPIAEEVKIIAEELGCDVYTIYDAGIAGLHRTAEALKKLYEYDVDVIVVVAGMEGALPSVIKSLTDLPVIGLPSSKGYGVGGRGKAALLSMLQSCAPGLLVVNIDNSVGAAIAAVSIANRVAKFRHSKGDTT